MSTFCVLKLSSTGKQTAETYKDSAVIKLLDSMTYKSSGF